MYTSPYPVTIYFYPMFSPAADVATPSEAEALTAGASTGVERLLYVHVPFCNDLCRFCPFHIRVERNDDALGRYVDSLTAEMALLARVEAIAEVPFQAVYVGGGSPSLLGPALVERLFDAIDRNFRLAPGCEISFEGEPRTLKARDLQGLLHDRGVGRLSFGCQTFDEPTRKLLNIVATVRDIDDLVSTAGAVGFNDINLDMLHGLPGQGIGGLMRDIERLAGMGLHSVDYYRLHYFAFPKSFQTAMAEGRLPGRPDPILARALHEQVPVAMAEAGFRMVADQVYSRVGLCEYFRLLWGGGRGDHRAETIAVGASARGYIGGRSYMNYASPAKVGEMVEAGLLPVEKISAPLDDPANRGLVFMPKFLGMDKRHADALASAPGDIIERWSAAGLLYDSGDALRLSATGRSWSDNMTVDALEDSQRLIAESLDQRLARRPGIRTGTF